MVAALGWSASLGLCWLPGSKSRQTDQQFAKLAERVPHSGSSRVTT
jgi:hypothetical protein